MQKRRADRAGAKSGRVLPILLDTHIAVWLALDNQRLRSSTVSTIKDSFNEGKLFLSAISAWEIGLLVSKGRLDLGQSPLAWFEGFVQQFNITVLEISPEIAINSSYLPGTLHGDPADRIIIATAMANATAIASADKSVVAYGNSGFVQVIAC